MGIIRSSLPPTQRMYQQFRLNLDVMPCFNNIGYHPYTRNNSINITCYYIKHTHLSERPSHQIRNSHCVVTLVFSSLLSGYSFSDVIRPRLTTNRLVQRKSYKQTGIYLNLIYIVWQIRNSLVWGHRSYIRSILYLIFFNSLISNTALPVHIFVTSCYKSIKEQQWVVITTPREQ